MHDDPSGKSCTPAADGNEMAKYLTHNYDAFDPKTMKGGSLGVYITMQNAFPDKKTGKLKGDLHHYCENRTQKAPCYKGRADCILSVALYNRHIMLDGDTQGAHLKTFADRGAGYVINTSKLENRLAKCAYIFDGASSHKLNYGCGNNDGVGDGPAGDRQASCHNPQSAYHNICPSTGKKCQPDDVEVRPRNDCTKIIDPKSKFPRPWPNTTGQTPCYFTGPAFRYPDYSKAKEDNLIVEMVKNRLYNEDQRPGYCGNPLDQCPEYPPEGAGGYCCRAWDHGRKLGCKDKSHECNRMAKWNEVVVDLRPMIDDLQDDPNGVIVAFVYSSLSWKPQAVALREAFKTMYGGPGDAPLIYMDQTVNVLPNLKKYGSPFVYKEETTREEVGALTWEDADEHERWMMTGKEEPSISV